MDWAGTIRRAIGAALLRKSVFEEIEHDRSLDRAAVAVVAVAATADGIGLMLRNAMGPDGFQPVAALLRLGFGIVIGIFVYYVMAYMIHYFGSGFFGAKGGVDQVRRTVGFAYGPRALGLLAFVPTVGPWLALLGWVWALAAGFVAARQALDISNVRTLATVVIAFVAGFLLFWFFAFMMGILYLPLALSGT